MTDYTRVSALSPRAVKVLHLLISAWDADPERMPMTTRQIDEATAIWSLLQSGSACAQLRDLGLADGDAAGWAPADAAFMLRDQAAGLATCAVVLCKLCEAPLAPPRTLCDPCKAFWQAHHSWDAHRLREARKLAAKGQARAAQLLVGKLGGSASAGQKPSEGAE